jgi:hypothetical protein
VGVVRTPRLSIKHERPAVGEDADVEAAIRVHEWTQEKLRGLMEAMGDLEALVLRRNTMPRPSGCGGGVVPGSGGDG